jgi:hypothetical protein
MKALHHTRSSIVPIFTPLSHTFTATMADKSHSMFNLSPKSKIFEGGRDKGRREAKEEMRVASSPKTDTEIPKRIKTYVFAVIHEILPNHPKDENKVYNVCRTLSNAQGGLRGTRDAVPMKRPGWTTQRSHVRGTGVDQLEGITLYDKNHTVREMFWIEKVEMLEWK